MAKDPAFLFYPGDWLGGTMHLDFECKGAYMELLMLQFQRGHMTYDMIAQVLGQRVGQIWPRIQDKFKTDGTYFWNERLKVEKEKRINYVQSRKNNREGANQHNKKSIKKIGHIIGHMTSHMENVNENVNEIIDNKKESEIFPSDILKSDELCFESLSREAGRIGVKITECLDKWDGWYCSKFTAWRKDWGDEKLTFNDLRKSFETWMRDPRSQDKNGTSHTNRDLIEERKRLAKNL